MTLILNEIRTLDGFSNSLWICGADRRLTFEGQFHSNRKKIYPIQYLGATVSYFGLAVWKIDEREKCMSDILKAFISKNSDCSSLDDFAKRLQIHLNNVVPKNLLKEYASGFHLSGFDNNKWPHFLHISNVGKMNDFKYENLMQKYKEPYPDFQDRDAKKHFNWDGINPGTAENKGWIYRNGDIRTHVLVSKKFDNMMKEVFELSDFTNLTGHKKLAEYLKFKFDFIARIYEKWTNNKVIGKPIDIYVLTPNGILENKKNKWQQLIE